MATIIHAVLGYFFLLLTVRVLSRRPGGQLTLYEFVIVFLIGGVIILSSSGKGPVRDQLCDRHHYGRDHAPGVSWLKSHYPRFGAIVDGTPLVLVENGNGAPRS